MINSSKKKLELFSLKDKFKPGKPLILHDEPIFFQDKIIGFTTSANYSFCYKKNIFLAYINSDFINYTGNQLEIEVEGKRYKLNFEKNALHDPDSRALRS